LRSVEQCYRGRDVRVFRLDQDGVIARLRERARALVARDPDVREVRLFGSLARHDAHPGSDADLFIVVRDGAPPFLDRIPPLARHFAGVGIGCDVIAYTESERASLAARHDAFARAVLEEGITLAKSSGIIEYSLSKVI
jgi:predicted nucleotidyltransferase